jgi:hypothetical protein
MAEIRMPVLLTRQEFRQWAEWQKQRYERIAGEPVAMSPERIDRAIQEPDLGGAGRSRTASRSRSMPTPTMSRMPS